MPQFESKRDRANRDRIARHTRRNRQEHDLAFALVARQNNIARNAFGANVRGLPAINGSQVRVSSPWTATSRAYLEANGLASPRLPRKRATAPTLDRIGRTREQAQHDILAAARGQYHAGEVTD